MACGGNGAAPPPSPHNCAHPAVTQDTRAIECQDHVVKNGENESKCVATKGKLNEDGRKLYGKVKNFVMMAKMRRKEENTIKPDTQMGKILQ